MLTIDGGGIKGVFPAAFLAEIEDRLGEAIYDYFDLIAGTSTGGIIAIGLGLGLTAGELLQLYKEFGPRIFHSHGFASSLRRLLRAKYSLEPLRQVVGTAFGNRLLGHSRKRLLVPALNLAAERVYIYRTAHHPRLVNDYTLPAIEVRSPPSPRRHISRSMFPMTAPSSTAACGRATRWRSPWSRRSACSTGGARMCGC